MFFPTCRIHVFPVPGLFLLHPLAGVNVAVGIEKGALALLHILRPLPGVVASVLPVEYAVPVTQTLLHMTLKYVPKEYFNGSKSKYAKIRMYTCNTNKNKTILALYSGCLQHSCMALSSYYVCMLCLYVNYV